MKRIIFYILILLASLNVDAQLEGDTKTFYEDGEYFIAYGDYKEALYNYLNIVKKGINNANIQYRIGQCYINLNGEKSKAIPYLIEATKSVTLTYNEGSVKEFQAPIDAFFFLGQAYLINGDFEKAKDNFRKFLALLPKEDEISKKYTEQQIKSCTFAETSIKSPKNYAIERLDEKINNTAPNIRPVVSANDSLFVFITKLKFYDGIFVANKKANSWSFPKNINQDVRSDGNLYPTGVSPDGKRILFTIIDIFNSDIYYSDYNAAEIKWSNYQKFKNGINSKYQETFASLSADNKTIYFTSNRKESIGGMDIFKIEYKGDDKWGPVQNLGATVNTVFDEESPYISTDGNKLFFSSQGHETMGGFDVFYCQKLGSAWSKPINLGSPLNTTDDDLYFVPIGNGEKGYIARTNPDGTTNEDIYIINLK